MHPYLVLLTIPFRLKRRAFDPRRKVLDPASLA